MIQKEILPVANEDYDDPVGHSHEIKTTSIFHILDRFVIKSDSQWKKSFDLIIILISIYNVISNAYYAAMKTQYNKFEEILNIIIESLFLADMIFCFFTEFKDPETYEYVDHFKPIAINYIKKSFVFDLIA